MFVARSFRNTFGGTATNQLILTLALRQPLLICLGHLGFPNKICGFHQALTLKQLKKHDQWCFGSNHLHSLVNGFKFLSFNPKAFKCLFSKVKFLKCTFEFL